MKTYKNLYPQIYTFENWFSECWVSGGGETFPLTLRCAVFFPLRGDCQIPGLRKSCRIARSGGSREEMCSEEIVCNLWSPIPVLTCSEGIARSPAR
jgi:hypothetical protein